MSPLALFAILLALSAVFGVINDRTLRLPNTIGVLLLSLLMSLLLTAIGPLIGGYDLRTLPRELLGLVDLPKALLKGALSFLLFAGALQVDVRQLWQRKLLILALALLGTLLAVALFGGAMWLVFPLVGPPVSLIWCIVLGAILAPTDPVSVVAMLRRMGLPAPLQAVFAGESLFNDGVGVVAFTVALGVATGDGTALGGSGIVRLFLLQVIGGGLLGLLLGLLAAQLMRLVIDAHLELIISLALATGTFSLANSLDMSGPIAVVVAGLTLGTRRNLMALSEDGQRDLQLFWLLVDDILNTILFLLIGFEIIAVVYQPSDIVAALIAIPLSIVVRAVSIVLATMLIEVPRSERRRALAMLTWGGLRGGISVAMALGLPPSEVRPTLLAVCYGVVVFTLVVQGLTIERLARWFYRKVKP